MSKLPFIDLNQKQVGETVDAIDQYKHLKLVSKAVAGGDDEEIAATARLARDFSDVTDSASLITSYLNLPEDLRDGIDAVIGLTAGSCEFEFVKDEDFAKRMGKSSKSVQRWRDKFMMWKDHGKLIQIKPNYQTPEGQSFPHRYKCNLTALAVDAAQLARLDAGYTSNPARRLKALEDAVEVVGKTAPAHHSGKRTNRRKLSDAAQLASNLKAATTKIEASTRLRGMIPNPDYEALYPDVAKLKAAIAAFEKAYEMEQVVHVNTIKEYVDSEQPETSDFSAPEPRMEASETVILGAAVWKNADHDMPVTVTGDYGLDADGRRYVSIAEGSTGIPLDEILYAEQGGAVDTVSTCTESTTYETKSTTYGEQPSRVFVSDTGDLHAPAGSTDEEIDAAWAGYEEKKRSGDAWARLENRLRPPSEGVQL